MNLWQVLEDDQPRDDVLHFVPLEDPHAHQAGAACWCCPTVATTADGTLYVHNRYDGPQQIH